MLLITIETWMSTASGNDTLDIKFWKGISSMYLCITYTKQYIWKNWAAEEEVESLVDIIIEVVARPAGWNRDQARAKSINHKQGSQEIKSKTDCYNCFTLYSLRFFYFSCMNWLEWKPDATKRINPSNIHERIINKILCLRKIKK